VSSPESAERLRRAYRPARVRLLFIGESPPASGRFFYRGDSGLYRAMRDAFRTVDPSIPEEDFLRAFQAWGCYLVDLCREPVDRLDVQSRRAACKAGEASLVRAMVRLRPDGIATLVRSIEGNVARAALRAHWQGPVLHLPYPGRWYRNRDVFIKMVCPALEACASGTLH
jgi:hypothetical protein